MVEKSAKLIFVYALAILSLVSFASASYCVLDSNDYDQVIQIQEKLVSDYASQHDANSSLYSIDLSSGEYSITVMSSDSVFGRENIYQPNEQFMIAFMKNGNEIFTPATTDLEDYKLSVKNVDEFSINLPNGADFLKAVHFKYDETPTTTSNSVYVNCIGIKKISDSPTCGDGVVNQASEECDGENNCTSSCTWEKEEPKEDNKRVSHGSILPYNECLPNWECSGWSECSNGVMTRNCIDTNMCEYAINEPHTTTDCVDPVIKESKIKDKSNNVWFILGIILFVVLLIVLLNLKK